MKKQTDRDMFIELYAEIAKLRERVAVLEQRTIPMVQIGQRVPPLHTHDPYAPPFTVTCEAAKQGGNHHG